jgi:hypothetical protein
MNELPISRVVDVAAQIFVFSLSRGIQDLNLGTSLGLQHSSDFGSFWGGSYLELPASPADTTIQDQNMNQLSNLNKNSHRAPQTDISPGTQANGPTVANADQMYAQGMDQTVMTAPNTDSGAMGQFEPFHVGALMQRQLSGQYMQTFDSNSSLDTSYRLDGDASYPIPADTFYHNDLLSFGTGNQTNTRHVLYQNSTNIQPSASTQYRSPSRVLPSPAGSETIRYLVPRCERQGTEDRRVIWVPETLRLRM